ncbi:hypothetical protein ACIHCV_32795 [Streptomyces sp. NPDC051956]|uniref:hypothetical protein n=1 Tax=Streptomyces sp. NPDC051956 TaxID=3365677 RepID=UPI0037D751A2
MAYTPRLKAGALAKIIGRRASGVAGGRPELLVWGALTMAAGLAAVLTASPSTYLPVKLLDACYLVFLGAQALWQNRHAAPATATHPGTTGARPMGSP